MGDFPGYDMGFSTVSTVGVSGFAPRRLRSKVHCTRGLCAAVCLNANLMLPRALNLARAHDDEKPKIAR